MKAAADLNFQFRKTARTKFYRLHIIHTSSYTANLPADDQCCNDCWQMYFPRFLQNSLIFKNTVIPTKPIPSAMDIPPKLQTDVDANDAVLTMTMKMLNLHAD